MKRTILIMAAGTGGHIFPGLAIAKELELRGWDVHWMGTPWGMENKIVGEVGYPMVSSFNNIGNSLPSFILSIIGSIVVLLIFRAISGRKA